MRGLRRFATTLLLVTGLVLGAGPSIAHAGPGATLFLNTSSQPISIPGSQLAAGDVPPTSYTRSPSAGGRATKVTLQGTSLRSLLLSNGVDPDAITFVNIDDDTGGVITVTAADLADPPPFPEGPVLFADDRSATRLLRPKGGRYATSAEAVLTWGAGPVQVWVNGGDIKVEASATPKRPKAGQTVTFTARTRFTPPGAQLTYEWDFGGGQVLSGQTVRRSFDAAGNYFARLAVQGTGGTSARCAKGCGGTDGVEVQVGDAAPQPDADDAAPGSGAGVPGAPGSSAGSGAGGQGGAGGAAGTSTTPGAAQQPKPAQAKPEPPPKPFGTTISGVLVDDLGATVRKLPGGTPAGAAKGAPESGGGDASKPFELSTGGVLALAVLMLGALRERRGVRLRVA